jgi:hypothetical protein
VSLTRFELGASQKQVRCVICCANLLGCVQRFDSTSTSVLRSTINSAHKEKGKDHKGRRWRGWRAIAIEKFPHVPPSKGRFLQSCSDCVSEHVKNFTNKYVLVSTGVYWCLSTGVYWCLSTGIYWCLSTGVYLLVPTGVYLLVSTGVYWCLSTGVYWCLSTVVYWCLSTGVYWCLLVSTYWYLPCVYWCLSTGVYWCLLVYLLVSIYNDSKYQILLSTLA